MIEGRNVWGNIYIYISLGWCKWNTLHGYQFIHIHLISNVHVIIRMIIRKKKQIVNESWNQFLLSSPPSLPLPIMFFFLLSLLFCCCLNGTQYRINFNICVGSAYFLSSAYRRISGIDGAIVVCYEHISMTFFALLTYTLWFKFALNPHNHSISAIDIIIILYPDCLSIC